MEEAVGKLWHRWITHKAESSFPNAAVTLQQVQKPIQIYFRALGGDGGLKIEATAPRSHGASRPLLQRIAGTHSKATLAWKDEQTLRLPAQLSLYNTIELNRDLYFWLAALASIDTNSVNEESWITCNQQLTQHVLKKYPGIRTRYQRLIDAELERRRVFSQRNEATIRQALITPGSVTQLPDSHTAPQPVYLWLYPAIPQGLGMRSANDQEEQTLSTNSVSQHTQQTHRYQAEQVEEPDGKDGLITMRWENIFSWAEHINVNRATDDDEDKEAARKAEDMDIISLSQDSKGSQFKISLDLDLPAAEFDDTPLQGEVTLPEWNWKKQRLIDHQCCIHPMLPKGATPKPLPPPLQQTARRLRNQFVHLAQQRSWQRNQHEGSEIDTHAYIDHYVNKQLNEHGMYRSLITKQRDMATLVLADLSMSTDAAVNNEQRVIDIIRDGLLLFSEALAACGDPFALYGFSSRKREHVRIYPLKRFEDRYTDTVRGNIQAIRPGYYTRMGAAIRHATQTLIRQAATKQLLLIITDGKPNDLDNYEGRYGIEDTRQAVIEAKQQGLTPLCITIDTQADDYLPYLFGLHHYIVIKRAEELPRKLLNLYARLMCK